MKTNFKDERGMALVFATMAIIVIAGSLALITTRVASNHNETTSAYNESLLEEAAQAGIDYAINTLWHEYISGPGNTTRNWANYRKYLDETLQIPKNEDLNFNGQRDLPHEAGDGRDGFNTYPDGFDRRGWAMLEEPLVLDYATENGGSRPLATVEAIHVGRYDTAFEAYLTVRSTANVAGRKKTAVQVLRIGGDALDHAQFAILANNISCILCHAEIRNIDLENNNDPDKFDSFDRVQVAALESMLVRKGEADSNVAGTVYTRGNVYNAEAGGALFGENELAQSSFKGYQFDNTNGKLLQNSSGSMSKVSLQTAQTGSDGKLQPMANLYRNYPVDPNEQTDGNVPNKFPAPYPDENNNRKVDDVEFEVIRNAVNGRIDMQYGQPQGGGSIKSGVAYGVPKNSAYSGSNLPSSSNGALEDLSTQGFYDGNLILVGTDDDPIKIDNTVAVDGDLVIKGKIQGEGQLLVRGNVYIAGDVTYKDDPGHFGKYDVQSDGSYKENTFALVAGGSVMMGDYLTVRGVNDSSQNNTKYPNWSQFSIDVRSKNKQGTSSNGTKLKYGYFDQYSVDANAIVSGRQGQQFSFTMSELQLFNNLEMDKALANPNYKPRFYGLREGQPQNIYLYTHPTDEHAVMYNESGGHVKTLQKYLQGKGWSSSQINAFMNNRASMHYLNPKSNWISESALRNIWYDDEMSRPSSYRDFQFDGLLYSNNSIFAITRSKTRHNSHTNGRMTIRGGIIAADLGIFVPGPGNAGQRGLNLMYDKRVERFLEVRDAEVVAFARSAFYFLPGDGMPDES